ncbi:MAG: PIN domain-containing protein [Rhodocyclales bacterium]|nr:PIN domain-containing protein [Rhodocyclales bacterium]
MREAKSFIDTNVLLYLLSADTAKADRAEEVIRNGGVVSVQVLNELASVATRKLKMPMADVRQILDTIRAVCVVVPLTEEAHVRGLDIAERYRLSIYDAMIVSAALLANCATLWSEDLHHGLVVEQRTTVRNPFH